MHRPSQIHVGPHYYSEQPARNICLKVFVIFVIAIGAITCITGILSLLAAQGFLSHSINNLMYLAKIGVVNSSVIIAGGFFFFMIGIAAWACHLHKEHLAAHRIPHYPI